MQPETPQSTNPAPETPAPAPSPAAPAQSDAPQGTTDPGKVLGVVSIVLPLVGLGLFGLICGIIGLKKSKGAGYGNTPAVVGIILSVISMVIGLAVALIMIFAISSTVQKCQELGPGVHYEGNTTYTCS